MKVLAGFLSIAGLILSSMLGYQLVIALIPTLYPLWLASTVLGWAGLVASHIGHME